MIYLLDTVALIRHFSGNKNIGKEARKLLNSIDSTDTKFAISIISLMEIMYLNERKRIDIELESTINLLLNNSAYNIVELNSEIVITAAKIKFYELHDRMILATAKWLDIPIISSDKKIC